MLIMFNKKPLKKYFLMKKISFYVNNYEIGKVKGSL